MDLIPKPDQVVSAAGNVAHKLLYGGLADLRPMPRLLIDDGNLREVYHYRPPSGVTEAGDPVLLVTPLAAPAICFDLRRGCSLVEHLVTRGRATYLVEYGAVSFKDRNLGIEHWVDEVVPAAIRAVSEHAGGRPVHVVGWSLGGIFALLTAADDPDLPIASVTTIGAPVDVSLVPLVAPLRPLLRLTDGRGAITRLYQAAGGAPRPLVRWAFQLSSFQKLVTKPLAVATRLDDTEFLAQLEAVDRFTANMVAYPGRSFGQLYHRFVKGNALVGGTMELDDRTIDLAAITAPVLVVGGATDGIAPIPAVRAVLPLLRGSREVRFEIVPGGHLGMLTGRAARDTTWQALDDWIGEWESAAPAPTPSPTPARGRKTAAAATRATPSGAAAAKKTAPKKAAVAKRTAPVPRVAGAEKAPAATKAAPAKRSSPAKKAPSRKTTPKATTGTTARKAAAKRAAAGPEAIGANPRRRYGSAGSRALGR